MSAGQSVASVGPSVLRAGPEPSSDRTRSLDRLLATAAALPGARDPVPLPLPTASTTGVGTSQAGPSRADTARLRRAVAVLLEELSRRADQALSRALHDEARAWDQVDALTIVDDNLRRDVVALERELVAGEAAVALEARLSIGATLALVELFERRLAALVRLRLGSSTPALVVDGRPFLDLSAALAEVALAWR